jgi:hypothetical protein
MAFCCEELAEEVGEHKAFAGGGFMYPPGMQPTGQIEQAEDGSWNVNGCCGGGCYVLNEIKFCPFCGTKLPATQS